VVFVALVVVLMRAAAVVASTATQMTMSVANGRVRCPGSLARMTSTGTFNPIAALMLR